MKILNYVFVVLAILVMMPFAAAQTPAEQNQPPATGVGGTTESNATAAAPATPVSPTTPAETPAAAASGTVQKPQLPSPGITPDSVLFGLDRALEQLQLLLAGTPEGKAKVGLEIAAERVAEARVMIEQKKFDAATIAKNEHAAIVAELKQNVAAFTTQGNIKEIELQVEIEKEIEEQEEAVEEVKKEIKIKVEGQLTAEQQAAINALIAAFQNQNGELKDEIKNKKDETKVEIKQKTGKTEQEVEVEVEKAEEKAGLPKLKDEKAAEQIADASEELTDVETKLAEFKGDITAVTKVLDEAKEKLANAEAAKAEGNFGEAFGQARAAEALIENAAQMIERDKEANDRAAAEKSEEIGGAGLTSSKEGEEGGKEKESEAKSEKSGGSNSDKNKEGESKSESKSTNEKSNSNSNSASGKEPVEDQFKR